MIAELRVRSDPQVSPMHCLEDDGDDDDDGVSLPPPPPLTLWEESPSQQGPIFTPGTPK